MRKTTASLTLTLICAGIALRPANGQQWSQASPATSPPFRVFGAMAFDSTHGQTVLFGGEDSNSNTLSDTWVYDGTNWTQKTPSTVPPARYYHAMAYDSMHGRVVLFGGFPAAGSSAALVDTWTWDGTNWTLQHPANSPPARARFAMAYDSSHGQVVLFGGIGQFDTWVWDGTNWTQKSPATTPPARTDQSMAYDSLRGQVVMFGGLGSPGRLNDTWVWDGNNWTQKSPITSPLGRLWSAMVFDALRSQVVLFGGYNGTALADTWVWDGNNWNPELSSQNPSARAGHAMVYDSAHGQVVLFGGGTGDTWLWSGSPFANWDQLVPTTSPFARAVSNPMAYDSERGQIVLFGGCCDNNSNVFSDTWVWNGNNWAQKFPVMSPSARIWAAMTYDAARGQVVLFGGRSGLSGPYLSDTWIWDGTNWSEKSPTSNPGPRLLSAMVYDAAHQQVVLFGGFDGSNVLNDTWVWDGTNWAQKSPTNSPPARTDHAMAYDSLHGQVVMFGGQGASGLLNDTWVWNGTNWTQKSPSPSPPSREDFAMVYDSAHGQVVLFGGSATSGAYLGDTWVWDGNNWSQSVSPASPVPRFQPGIAYDSVRGQLLLFGGSSDTFNCNLSDTWLWEDGFYTSPNSGSGTGPQIFNTTYFDDNGASDLQAVYIDFGSAGDSPHDCKMAYVPGSNSLYLFNDANNGIVSGSLVLGGGSSLSNSQCTLFGGNTAATLSGNHLIVPFDIQFLPAYGGLKNIFAVAQTYGGIQSGNGAFETLGTWTPSATTPGVVSVTPSSGSGLGPQVFTAKFSDSGGANDLQAVYLDFGSVGGFAPQNCIVVYTPGLNLLYLFNDNNTGAVGPISLGAGGGSISNSQCTLSSGTTPATLSGTILTVPFDITFKSGYGGKKFIFGLSQTYAGVQSNGGAQIQLGTWEPATSTPAAVSVTTPGGGGGSSGTFTASYSDTGGANDLQVVYLSFSATKFLAINSCNVGYEPGNNSLFLLSDNNSTIATLGEGTGSTVSNSVSNSQCTLFGGNTAAAELGTGLTVPFTIAFKSGFTSPVKIFGLAQTYDGTQSAITTLGLWTP